MLKILWYVMSIVWEVVGVLLFFTADTELDELRGLVFVVGGWVAFLIAEVQNHQEKDTT
jgi:predicted membrane channel-forming protein YqfA (hemolysin III family)